MKIKKYTLVQIHEKISSVNTIKQAAQLLGVCNSTLINYIGKYSYDNKRLTVTSLKKLSIEEVLALQEEFSLAFVKGDYEKRNKSSLETSKSKKNSPVLNEQIIHYAWIGLPTLCDPLAIAGHDLAGPIEMAKKLQSQRKGNLIAIYFWCLQSYQGFYEEQFALHKVNITACSIEKLLQKEIAGSELPEQALFTKKYIEKALAPEKNSLTDRISAKDIFSLFLLLSQPGYFFDTTIFPLSALRTRPISVLLENSQRVKTASTPYRENDFYMMYSPQRCDSVMRIIFKAWANNPGYRNLRAFYEARPDFLPHSKAMGVEKLHANCYRKNKAMGLFYWLFSDNHLDFNKVLPYGNINQQTECCFSIKPLTECSLCFMEHEAKRENLLNLPFRTNDAYVATYNPHQIFYVNKSSKHVSLVADGYSNLFYYFPGLNDLHKIRIASESVLILILQGLSKNNFHPPYLVNIDKGSLLHHAVLIEDIKKVKLLLELGARIDLIATYHVNPQKITLEFTALELATYLEHEEIINLLVSHPAQNEFSLPANSANNVRFFSRVSSARDNELNSYVPSELSAFP